MGHWDYGFCLCFVGRIVKDKGINELVRSFVELKNLIMILGYFLWEDLNVN